MLLDRRSAVLGLAASAGAGLPFSRAWAQTAAAPAPETPAADEPATQIGASRDKFEHLIAPVAIDDQGPFNFILDTGANVSCVSKDLAQRLMLASAGVSAVHTMVGVRERPSVMIKTLTIGDRRRRNVRAPALPTFGGQVDGVLGVDWLGGQRLVLDLKHKTIEITPSRFESARQNRVIVPCRRRLGQLTIVDADLSGHRISAMIDSGSQATMCNARLHDLVLAMEAHSRVPREHQPVQLETIAGEPFHGEMFYLPFLRLGGLDIGNVPTVYSWETQVFDIWGLKDTPALVLGMDLLAQFEAVAMDFSRNQVRFDIA
jgi:hypothetical protein